MLEIINNTSSRVVLQCTRAYTTENSKYPPITYKVGDLKPRNEIFLRPGHWKVCCKTKAEKYWKSKNTTFVN